MSEGIDRIRKQMKDKQIQRIISMETGRFMDSLVAEYVVGLHVELKAIGMDAPVDYWYRPQGSIFMMGDQAYERVPNYSTVLYSAVQLLPKFQYWSLQGNSDEGGISARFSNNGDARIGVIDCASIPEAICKAALITLVEEQRLLDRLLEDEE